MESLIPEEITMDKCLSCEITDKAHRGESLTTQERNHRMMWGCTCSPEAEAAAIAYMDAVTR